MLDIQQQPKTAPSLDMSAQSPDVHVPHPTVITERRGKEIYQSRPGFGGCESPPSNVRVYFFLVVLHPFRHYNLDTSY